MRSSSTGSVEATSSAHFRPNRIGHPTDYEMPVEGLRMIQDFNHLPVMLRQVVDVLGSVPKGLIVDATVGGGGHSEAILMAYPDVQILGIDQDVQAIEAAGRRLARFGSRVQLRQDRFDHLAEALVSVSGTGADGGVSGILFDLGVSSHQLDRPERGFSYRFDTPLDMRMDQASPMSAADLVNSITETELIRILRDSGEAKWARRIAREIISSRPIATTGDLVGAVERAVPLPARRRGHPARRVFQAIRIEVNNELDVLEAALPAALAALVPGGRCVVLSYHSGEDRLVKGVFFEAATGGCRCLPGLPCVCGAISWGRVVRTGSGAQLPDAGEAGANPRSEAARMRVFERAAKAVVD